MLNSDQTSLSRIQSAFARRDFKSAEAEARKAISWAPRSADLRLLLAQSLDEQGRTEDAEECLSEALRIGPDLPQTNLIYGIWLQGKGAFDDARSYLLKSIEIEPNQGMAHLSLAKCGRVTGNDREWVAQMESLSQVGFDLLQRSYLFYALGKAYEDLGDFEKSIGAFDQANVLCRSFRPETQNFSPAKHQESRARIRGYFNPSRVQAHTGIGSPTRRPIFIVGMPRSGTTLIEQMLSAHSKIGAAGELGFWMLRASSVIDQIRGELDPTRSRLLAEEYDQLLRSKAPWAEYVTDKMPLNYLQLGYIHMLLPNATLIHVQRSALDNALSLYTTDYKTPPEFAHNRENIVFAYRQYEELMRHWRKVLPEGRLIEIQYEDLIESPKQGLIRILKSCGLDFEEACLHPERNDRPIRTPSLWQARQAIYQTSRERWRKFEPWLGAFRELLGP